MFEYKSTCCGIEEIQSVLDLERMPLYTYIKKKKKKKIGKLCRKRKKTKRLGK